MNRIEKSGEGTAQGGGGVDESGVENTESEPHVSNAGLEAVVTSKMSHIHVLCP